MTREQREFAQETIEEANRISREKDAEMRQEREQYKRRLGERERVERQREAERQKEMRDMMAKQQEYRERTDARIQQLSRRKSGICSIQYRLIEKSVKTLLTAQMVPCFPMGPPPRSQLSFYFPDFFYLFK